MGRMRKGQNRGVGSHDAIKLLNDESVELIKATLPSPDATWVQQVSGRSTMRQLDIHGSQWQGPVDVTKVISRKIFHKSSSCNKVVDMPVEVQRQEPMVSSNKSRENDKDSVTTSPTRSQRR